MAILPTRTSSDTNSSADINELSSEALDKGGTSQLSALTAEASPASGDLFLMEDGGTGVLKKVDTDNMPGGGGGGGVGQLVFYVKGNAYVDTSVLQALMGGSATPSKVRAYADTAPVGAALEIDFNKNGVSIMNTVLSIAAAANAGTSTDFTGSPTFAAGDRISVDIDQVGSSTAGGDDLMITIEF